ncbi:hypothetical protein ACFL96_13685, partial [Thermoproteota archaeon]
MKKAYIIIIMAALFLVSSSLVHACQNEDFKFNMIVTNQQPFVKSSFVDVEKLKGLCTQETCTIEDDYIAIKSSYNPEVSLIMGNTGGTLSIKGLMTKLPYEKNGSKLIPTSIIPEEYNWKESIKADLTYLK